MAENMKTASIGRIDLTTGSALPAFTAIPAEGLLVPWGKGDHRMLLLVKNTGGTEAVLAIKKGDSIQAVDDLTVNIPAGEIRVFTPESGKYKHTAGDMKGNIQLMASTALIHAAAVYTA